MEKEKDLGKSIGVMVNYITKDIILMVKNMDLERNIILMGVYIMKENF